MKTSAILVMLVLASSCLSQPINPTGSGGIFGQQTPPFLNLLMYRNLFDMNWLPAMMLSGQFGGGGNGGMGVGGILPWLWFGNM